MFRRGLERLKVIQSEEGSISILVIGLFTILLALALILTDISAIYLAKRSLNQSVEAAAQRALTNLDQESYYTGEYNLNRLGATLLGAGEEDPGVPINCSQGKSLAGETLSDIGLEKFAELELVNDVTLNRFECDGYSIYIEASAQARLPIPIPFTQIESVEIHTHAGGIVERAETNNYYGFDIG